MERHIRMVTDAVIVTRNGTVLRVLSPNLAALSPGWSGTLNGYLDPYIKQAWQKYTTADLRIDTQSAWGTLVGRVGATGLLTFPRVGSFANCSVPSFVTTTARLAAALNRGTLLANPNQPDGTTSGFTASEDEPLCAAGPRRPPQAVRGMPSRTTTCTPPATTPKAGSWIPTRHG
jgi:hypothetical protein